MAVRMAQRGNEPPILLVKWYDVTKWLLERVDSFPKNQRFIFGQRIADRTLNVLEALVEAAYSSRKADLNSYLPTLGMDITGWTLMSARGISADSSAIVGYGTFNGALRAFLVRGLFPCGVESGTGDGNADGTPDGLDLQGLVNTLIQGESGGVGNCAYDMNHDSHVDAADVPIFVETLLGP